MRLKQIKLAGFKSFVDPTTIVLPGNLTGIVGPNGCGKSNVIDAVRWVMGESSARHLRGESMADVIFNGSGNRKPAGHAAIELHFDNSAGKWGGMLAQYSEIVIRRQVNLDGQSTYYLNGTVCRRRDIADLFFGTGLATRNSYAIIAQGDISRFIEAKPDELRTYLEEAAGISRYKERRRETELRLQHTRENLDRLNDVRDELQRQSDHLSKQAATAEKFQHYEQKTVQLRKQLLGWRAQHLQETIQQAQEKIVEQEQQVAQANAEWQRLTEERETLQQTHYQFTENVNQAQAAFYEIHQQLTSTEQNLQHHQQREQQFLNDQSETERLAETALHQLTQAQQQAEALTQQIQDITPQWQAAEQAVVAQRDIMQQAEAALQTAQQEWEQLQQQAAQHVRQAEVEQTRLQHSEKQLARLEERWMRIQQESEHYAQLVLPLEDLQTLEQQVTALQEQLAVYQQQQPEWQEKLNNARQQQTQQHQLLDQARTELQALRGRLASLQALQEAALGKTAENLKNWLQQQQLENCPHLLEQLTVEPGWEIAAETICSEQLQALCVDNLTALFPFIEAQAPAGLMLVDSQSAASPYSAAALPDAIPVTQKITAPAALQAQLQSIYLAENLAAAQMLMAQLPATASVITRDGIWLGQGWLRVRHAETLKSGVIARERDLQALQQHITQQIARVENAQQQAAAQQAHVQEMEMACQEHQQLIAKTAAQQSDLQAQWKVQHAQWQQLEERRARLARESEELQQQQAQENTLLATAKNQWQHWLHATEQDQIQQENYQQQRAQAQAALTAARAELQQLQQQAHQYQTQQQVLQTQQQACAQQQAHWQERCANLQIKQNQLQEELTAVTQPQEVLHTQLQRAQQQQQQAETHLQTLRMEAQTVEIQLRELSRQQQTWENERDMRRSQLEQQRLAGQTFTVQLQNIQEQITALGETVDSLLAQLPEAIIAETALEEEIAKLQQRMARLGPINSAAISEHQALQERKQYLDQQYDDLTTALATLDEAIRKIDRETRTRFKDVYDQVNASFQALFPRIFGGGSATLTLTDDDILQSGITIMARPPGKRNTTIHLLSGGEKALTAIALVFSLFQLNPAPFCLLDEVDAPLDDANVGRFCDLVREMAKTVQMIFISHNKLAIAMAEHLIGVTMHEPGVSRLVAVDVQAALEMAEA